MTPYLTPWGPGWDYPHEPPEPRPLREPDDPPPPFDRLFTASADHLAARQYEARLFRDPHPKSHKPT